MHELTQAETDHLARRGGRLAHTLIWITARNRVTGAADDPAAQPPSGWLLRQDGVIAIPKSGNRQRVEENFGALDLTLDVGVLAALDRIFPPPDGATESL